MTAAPAQGDLPLPHMGQIARTWLMSMLLGFHNAWEQEEVDLAELGIRIVAADPGHSHAELAHPERCFFWGGSSLLN